MRFAVERRAEQANGVAWGAPAVALAVAPYAAASETCTSYTPGVMIDLPAKCKPATPWTNTSIYDSNGSYDWDKVDAVSNTVTFSNSSSAEMKANDLTVTVYLQSQPGLPGGPTPYSGLQLQNPLPLGWEQTSVQTVYGSGTHGNENGGVVYLANLVYTLPLAVGESAPGIEITAVPTMPRPKPADYNGHLNKGEQPTDYQNTFAAWANVSVCGGAPQFVASTIATNAGWGVAIPEA